MADTVRIDLPDDQWIEIRTRVTLGDTEHIELSKLKHGGETTPALSMIWLLERILTAWSFAETISDQTIRDVLDAEAISLMGAAIAEARRPNSSSPSRAGGRRKAKIEASHQ